MSSLKQIWRILCWNIRGLNNSDKWPLIYNKIEESLANIICFQETKKGDIDLKFLRNFVPKIFDCYAYIPSDGASGGLLVIWIGHQFLGRMLAHDCFGMVMEFTSKTTLDCFTLVNVYGPCDGIARDNFIAWLCSLDIQDDAHWLIIEDFNFYRYSDSRNRPSANLNDIETFNEVISYLGLIELPIKGRSYTWSNMQADPTLTQLDWFFTSHSWTLKYPNTLVNPLARPTSDHVPCVISIGTDIPKAQIFRFENHWIHMPGFMEVVRTYGKSIAREMLLNVFRASLNSLGKH